MRRLELLNHNKLHKHYKLVDKVNEQILEFKKQQHKKQQEQQVISWSEAAKRVVETIKENEKNDL